MIFTSSVLQWNNESRDLKRFADDFKITFCNITSFSRWFLGCLPGLSDRPERLWTILVGMTKRYFFKSANEDNSDHNLTLFISSPAPSEFWPQQTHFNNTLLTIKRWRRKKKGKKKKDKQNKCTADQHHMNKWTGLNWVHFGAGIIPAHQSNNPQLQHQTRSQLITIHFDWN